MFHRTARISREVVRWMRKHWARVRRYLKLIGPCWFALVVTLVLAAATLHPQTVDAMAEFAEDRGFLSGPHVIMLLALLIFSTAIWYICRVMLYVRFAGQPRDLKSHETEFITWIPRIAGVLPIFAAAGAFLISRKFFFVLLYVGLASLFLYVLNTRRKTIERRRRKFGEIDSVVLVHVQSRLPDKSKIVVAGALLAALTALIALLVSPVTVPQMMGPLGVLYVAGAVWVTVVSTLLIYPSRRFRLPSLFAILILMAVVFGAWNDNHRVHPDLNSRAAVEGRPPLSSHFDAWLQHRGVKACGESGCYEPFPVFIVAAEGGGIRAAYWTAAVLNAITREAPEFACHLFALSGVSGGSLGSAAFAARLADTFDLANDTAALCSNMHRKPGQAFLDASKSIRVELKALSQDFLSPVVAGMLFPDLVQRFLPVAVLPDRASYLEKSWESAWIEAWENERAEPGAAGHLAQRHATQGKGNPFSRDFLDLWAEDLGLLTPSLFMNATRVETGQRAIVSNIQLTEDEGHHDGFRGDFGYAYDLLDRMGGSVPLSQAVHFSARFTYLSPAATVSDRMSGKSTRIVDGGYFENSGVTTAREIATVLDRHCGAGKKRRNCSIHVLVISNDVGNPNRWQEEQIGIGRGPNSICDCAGNPRGCLEHMEKAPGIDDQEPSPSRLLAETLSPVETLFATRSARGYLAEEQLFRARPCNTYRAQLQEMKERAIPLGWILSDRVRESMEAQADVLPTGAYVGELITTPDPGRYRRPTNAESRAR